MALDLEAGSSQYIALPSGALSTLQNVAEATIMCWVKLESLPGNEMFIIQFSNGTSTTSGRASISWRNTTGYFRTSGRQLDANAVTILDASTFGTISTGIWYHLTGVFKYSTGMLEIYVNGILSDSLAVGLWVGNTSNTASLGASIGANGAGGNNFDGIIDDTRIYNRALTANEIKTIYNSRGKDSIILNLSHRYTLGELNSGATATGAGTIKDKKSSAGNATPTNNPVYASENIPNRRKRI